MCPEMVNEFHLILKAAGRHENFRIGGTPGGVDLLA